jgi:hypothetical protein
MIYELDVVQETRLLSPSKLELRYELKANILGLAPWCGLWPGNMLEFRVCRKGTPTPSTSTYKLATAVARITCSQSPTTARHSVRRKLRLT